MCRSCGGVLDQLQPEGPNIAFEVSHGSTKSKVNKAAANDVAVPPAAP